MSTGQKANSIFLRDHIPKMAMMSRFILLNVFTGLLHIYTNADVCRTRLFIQLVCPVSGYGVPLYTHNYIKSAVTCSQICSKDLVCRAFLYYPGDKLCLMFGGKLTTVHQSCANPDIKYGEIKQAHCRGNDWMFEGCNDDGDCPVANNQCLGGRCECDYGYPYDYRTDSCPPECANYGQDLREVSIYLKHHNDAEYPGYTKTQCIEKCLSVSSFVCRFIEYDRTTGTCRLSTDTARTAPGAVRSESESEWWKWERNCA